MINLIVKAYFSSIGRACQWSGVAQNRSLPQLSFQAIQEFKTAQQG